MGIRPRLSPRCRRLIIPLAEAGAAALGAEAQRRQVTIRWLVLEALIASGVVSCPAGVMESVWRGSRNGAGRRRSKTSGYEISVELPDAAMEQLREVVQRTGHSAVFLVLTALRRTGIPVSDFELAVDRRKRGHRTPRRHYADGVRSAGRARRLRA